MYLICRDLKIVQLFSYKKTNIFVFSVFLASSFIRLASYLINQYSSLVKVIHSVSHSICQFVSRYLATTKLLVCWFVYFVMFLAV